MPSRLRLSFRPWVIRNGRLHSPRSFATAACIGPLLLVLGLGLALSHSPHIDPFTGIPFLIAGAVFLFMSGRELRRWGTLGAPFITVGTDRIICGRQLMSSGQRQETPVYPDDVIHVAGPARARVVRLVSATQGERTIQVLSARGDNSRLLRFIVNRLRRRHQVLVEDPPTLLQHLRGDY